MQLLNGVPDYLNNTTFLRICDQYIDKWSIGFMGALTEMVLLQRTEQIKKTDINIQYWTGYISKKKQNWIHNLNAIYISLVPHSGPFSPFSHLYKIVLDSWCLCRDVSAGPWNSKYRGGPTLPRSLLFLLSVRSNADPSLSHTERWGFRRRGWSSLQSQGLMCSLLRRIAISLFLPPLSFSCSAALTTLQCQKYTHTDLKCLKRCHQGL